MTITHTQKGVYFVKPQIEPEKEINGIINPEKKQYGAFVKGVVAHIPKEGSEIKVGDIVMYQEPIKQLTENSKDTFYVEQIEGNDGQILHVVTPRHIISVNYKPVKDALFIEKIADLSVDNSGILMLDTAKGFVQKGKVFMAHPDSLYKKGDNVKYRKNESDIFSTIEIGGTDYQVLYEQNIYERNGQSGEYSLLVEIDKRAQREKQEKTDSGIYRAPAFLFMKQNLQYGKVLSIGKYAQERYPSLSVGDTAIFHHSIETQPHRILKEEKGLDHQIIREQRVISVLEGTQELYGKFDTDNESIIPFGNHIFLEWGFSYHEQPIRTELFTNFETDFHNCKDLEDLAETIRKQKSEAVKIYQMRENGLKADLARLPNILDERIRDAADLITSKIESGRRDSMILSRRMDRGEMLLCKIAFINEDCARAINAKQGDTVLVNHKTLYPLNVRGKNYILVPESIIVGKLND